MFHQYTKDKMPSFKLTYFPAKARAEPIRLLFAQAGVEYEDCRIEFAQFQSDYKNVVQFGHLPSLEVDGKPLSESLTILRYLARLFGLAGKNMFDQAQAESVVDALAEVQGEIFKFIFEKDEDVKKKKIKELEEGKVTKYLATIDKMIKDNKNSDIFVVGDSVTFADIFMYEIISKLVILCGDDFLKKCPQVAANYKHVGNLPNIKAWLAKRPETPF